MRNEHAGYRDREAWIRVGLLGMELERLRLQLNDQHGETMKKEQKEAFEKRFEERFEYLSKCRRHAVALAGAQQYLKTVSRIRWIRVYLTDSMEVEVPFRHFEKLVSSEVVMAERRALDARAALLQLEHEEPPRDGGGE